MTNSEILSRIEAIYSRTKEKVSDWPAPTCSKIDGYLAAMKPLQQEAGRLYRYNAENLKEDEGLESFVSDVLDLVDSEMPAAWEDIRSDNDGLRTSLSEVLEILQDVRNELSALIGQIPFEGSEGK